MISYAQNYEDVILERFFRDKVNGFYVDVGAANPTLNSVTKHFYEKGWTGINIEPSTLFFNELVKERVKDICLNIAITSSEDYIEFFDLPNTGLSSINKHFNISEINSNCIIDYHGNIVKRIEKYFIETNRLDNILKKYANEIEIDFLKIDVEGAEKEVIESNNWSLFRPKVLLIEATIPNSKEQNYHNWENILVEADYTFVYFDGLNRFYLRNDQLNKKEIFSYPPCFFDEFIHYSEELKSINIKEIEKSTIEVQELYSQNYKLKIQNQELDLQLKTVYKSSSWRITAPIRSIVTLTKTVGNPIKFSKNYLRKILNPVYFFNKDYKNLYLSPFAENLNKNEIKIFIELKKTLSQSKKLKVKLSNIENHLPKLAFISPLPPERSGISDYSAELIPALSKYYEIDVIIDQKNISNEWIKRNCSVRNYKWFKRNTTQYDRVLYHFGNSPFHKLMFQSLENFPGVIVLHDFYLSHIIAHLDEQSIDPYAVKKSMYYSHGYLPFIGKQLSEKQDENLWNYPCNLKVIQDSLGVIVHSRYSTQLAEKWYGLNAAQDWSIIPMLKIPLKSQNKSQARKELDFNQNQFIVCSFGIIGHAKLNKRLLDCWISSSLSKDKNCLLVFVGEIRDSYGQELSEDIKKNDLTESVFITGWTELETFKTYLSAADIGVQLRAFSRGETSAAVFDCLNYGLATIANANGSVAELSDEFIFKISDDFSDEELIEALETLWNDENKRILLAKNAKELIQLNHSPEQCAHKYMESIESYYQKDSYDKIIFSKEISEFEGKPSDDQKIKELAIRLSKDFPILPHQKQLLVDVTAIRQKDLKTGIQRVVRSILRELLANPPEGFRVEPVFTINGDAYYYARKFTMQFLNQIETPFVDEPIEYQSGDFFLGLDLLLFLGKSSLFDEMTRNGVIVVFTFYDILPVSLPEFFPTGNKIEFEAWLKTVLRGNGAICISKATADEARKWMELNIANYNKDFKFGWFHLGADIEASVPTLGLPANYDEVIAEIKQKPTFLSVGTIEPRKGHSQTLDAFDILWNDGIDINLVIVGKQGWMMESMIERINQHPEINKRLFWFNGISDEFLEKIYHVSTCLLAPSEGEGFGLPLIEAAQINIPIIARNLPVFREVANDYAYYFDGLEGSDLASAIISWLNLHKSNQAPKSNGMPFLTWAQSAKQLKDFILNIDRNY
jgi:FkbM family methyltransferase